MSQKSSIVMIRDLIINSTNSIITVIRIILLSKFFLKKITRKSNTNEAVVLGNGPSLNEFLKNTRNVLDSRAVFAVNNFARTKEYVEIKPDYYVICSPEHFMRDEKEDFHDDRKKTFRDLAEKTDWKIQLIVPAFAKSRNEWKKDIIKNSNISIRYMNTAPVEGFKKFRHFMFKKQLGMPRPHNVLIPSIYLAINLRFSKVLITGADHSWLKEIVVTDQNDVLLSQKHFYDNQVENEKIQKNKPGLQPMFHGVTTRKRKLHEVLEKFYISFKSYWILRKYADARNVEVVNLTKGSFIDAFKKQKVE